MENKANALKDLCKLEHSKCRYHIKTAYRKLMPQLDSTEMKRFAKKGKISRILLQPKLNRKKLTIEQKRILKEICDTCEFKNKDVPVSLETVNLSELTVTQNEANIDIINAIISTFPTKSSKTNSKFYQDHIYNMTKETPIIISNDNKVIDGHHRFHAIQTIKPNAFVYVIRLKVNHYRAMIISWALSKESHSF